jgi:gas vesicle protein
MIADGTSHRFIINNNYHDDIFVHGTLSANNLNILGTTTTINTASYTTENLQIVSIAVDGPALLISQTGDGTNNVLTAEYNDDELMVIKSSGNVGIGVSDPTTKLQIDGTVTASLFAGDGSTLTNVNLNDRTTTLLTEGTNLYYTAARVGVIVLSSNVETSNYINNTSNELANTIQATSNIISERITSLNTVSGDSTSNYINNTSNELANTIQATSNIISERITSLNTVSGDSTSNYINNTSNELANTIQATSNIISECITNTELSISNYINNTSNELANTIQATSNTISHRISNLNADMIADGNLHKFIINDTYDANLQVNGTLTVSNLNIIGTSTIINTSTYTTENLLISTDGTDGPALAIDVNGITDSILITSNDITTFIINEQNNVGIGVSTPSEKLEISGSVKADYFKGNGIYLHNVNLSDKSTSELVEGSNLYYTNERVSLLIDSSNIGLSNDIIGFINNLNFSANTSNQLVDYIRTKQNIINGAASSITNYNLISNRVVVSSLTGKITESSIRLFSRYIKSYSKAN